MKIKNLNELKEFIKDNLGNEYILLNNEYKNTRTILSMKHSKCNKEYTVIAYNILKDKPTKCPYCYGRKRKTLEEIKEKFKAFNNGEFEVISGNYKNNKSKLTFLHHKCNKTFEGVVENILNGYKKCPYCNPYRSITTYEFQEKIGNEYTVLGEYINNHTKIKIKHNKCNNIFEITPESFYKKVNKCPYCTKCNKKDTDIFKFEVNNLVGNEYTVLGEYINNSTKIKMKHNKCNNIYEVTPSNFSLGYRCPKCAKEKQKLSNEEFLLRVADISNNEYIVLDNYINTETKLRFKHLKCNNIFKMTPHHFLAGQRCPSCKNNYIGEERIATWLRNHDLFFERNYMYKDLYDKSKNHPLKFDFFVKLNDDIILIEFDGIQHEKEWCFGSLEDYKRRDNLKNKYCKKNNIRLLRISYKDFNNIERILNEELLQSPQ